jgi:hypothetical protein
LYVFILPIQNRLLIHYSSIIDPLLHPNLGKPSGFSHVDFQIFP